MVSKFLLWKRKGGGALRGVLIIVFLRHIYIISHVVSMRVPSLLSPSTLEESIIYLNPMFTMATSRDNLPRDMFTSAEPDQPTNVDIFRDEGKLPSWVILWKQLQEARKACPDPFESFYLCRSIANL